MGRDSCWNVRGSGEEGAVATAERSAPSHHSHRCEELPVSLLELSDLTFNHHFPFSNFSHPKMQSYNIYSLPHELLASLTPRHLWNETIQDSAQSPPIDSLQSLPATNTGPRACNICLGISFTDVEEQRTHYRSDWHRYNVKTRINGGNSVTEAQFGQLVDGASSIPFSVILYRLQKITKVLKIRYQAPNHRQTRIAILARQTLWRR